MTDDLPDVDAWRERWERHAAAAVDRWARATGPPVDPYVLRALEDWQLDAWAEHRGPLPPPLIDPPDTIAELDPE